MQELVDLDMIGSVMETKNKERVLAWENVIRNSLRSRMPNRKFVCQMRKVMYGCLIFLFVREDSVNSIKRMHTSKIKTGVKGIAANKGSTALRFNYDDTSLMFMNCHLTSGQKKVKERFDDLQLCYTESCQSFITNANEQSGEQDLQFLIGDMNWRVNLTYDEAVSMARENQIKEMRSHDQLVMLRNKHPLTARFSEGELTFKPTFKYDKESDQYDTSKKMSVPSWTDRILYKPQFCKLLYYNRREHKFSDHRPVLGIFECTVKKTNVNRKNELFD